jgi:peptide deformylase
MPAQTILRYPDPLLKQVCARIEPTAPPLDGLIQDLIDPLRAGPGSVGVAAPQIGSLFRVCVVNVAANRLGAANNHGLLVMVNPEITRRDGEGIMREGCMSVPDYTGDVARATSITVSFIDRQGEQQELDASGFEAVAIQHEMDHLDGILFLDRVTSLKTGLFRRKNYR